MTGYIDPEQLLPVLIGLNYQEALFKCARHEYTVRISIQDGKPHVLTRDYKKQRVNLTLVDGLVTAAAVG